MLKTLKVADKFLWRRITLSKSKYVRLSTKADFKYERNVVESPFAEAEIPNMHLTEYVFHDYEKYKSEKALTCGASKRSYNYGTTVEMTYKMAKALLSQRGCALRKTDVVGIILPNIPEFTSIIHGSLSAGLKVTFVNPLYKPDEVCRQFENAGVKLIVTLPVLLPVAEMYRKQTKNYRGTICVGEKHDFNNQIFGFESLLMEDHKADLPKINPNDVAIIPYSSGTTGLPKGVMLTHRNLVSNLAQGATPGIARNNQPEFEGCIETVLTIPPFFHIYGFNGALNPSLLAGSHVITIPRFIPEDYIQCLIEHRPTMLIVVPSLLLFLATHPKVTSEHLSCIDYVIVGAAPAPLQLQERFKSKCGKDVEIAQGYGMTESSPVTLFTPYKYDISKVGTCGQLYPHTQAKIVSLTDGSNLGPHQPGELHVRGPQIMKGYLDNVQATKETIDDGGWLHTGDVAYYDNGGYFFIVDRTKELIKVKGNQVSPTELENIIIEIPEIADVAVTGILDAISGEIPRAYVVLKPGVTLLVEDVLEHVKEKVVKYKQLAGGVRFVKNIPRNAGGKILRKELHLLEERMDDQ